MQCIVRILILKVYFQYTNKYITWQKAGRPKQMSYKVTRVTTELAHFLDKHQRKESEVRVEICKQFVANPLELSHIMNAS